MNNSFHRERKLQTVINKEICHQRVQEQPGHLHLAHGGEPPASWRVKTATHSAGGGGGETQGLRCVTVGSANLYPFFSGSSNIFQCMTYPLSGGPREGYSFL